MKHQWSGNVRELKNVVQRAYYMSDKVLISSVTFPKSTEASNDFKEHEKAATTYNLKDIEKESILKALSANKGNIIMAANDLNISRATIYRKIKMYSIDMNNSYKYGAVSK
jgi:transcriptional regulator of acetoin/glycerol metabolism